VNFDSLLGSAVRDFMMMFVTIDPIGTLCLFVPLTASIPAVERPRVARRAVLYAGLVLFGFMLFGQIVLNGLGVRLTSFQLAGGVILFLLGLQMVFGTGIAAHRAEVEPGRDIAVFPLGIPSIAGPGAMLAAVVLTDNDRFSLAEQLETAAMLLLVLVLTVVVLLQANRIHRLLGETGANVLVRIMGMVLAALAAEQMLDVLGDVVRGLRA
jgi:multiple antibiotic resistance protein